MKKIKKTFLISLFLISFFSFEFIQREFYSKIIKEDYFLIGRKENQLIYEIDFASVYTAEKLGAGFYCQEIDALVPLFPDLARAELLIYKNAIAERIGPIFPSSTHENEIWRNSADTIDLLIEDAKVAAPTFLEICKEISVNTGSGISFGINNRSMIKSKKSILRKVDEVILEEKVVEREAVKKVRDSLRGTIIAETPEEIPFIIESIKKIAQNKGCEVIFINIWEENRLSGYVGIHAKLLLPFNDDKNGSINRKIITEIQIHLRCIMDGTKTCAKERVHLLYEQMHQKKINPEIQSQASALLYLTALKNCPFIEIDVPK